MIRSMRNRGLACEKESYHGRKKLDSRTSRKRVTEGEFVKVRSTRRITEMDLAGFCLFGYSKIIR